MKISVIIPTYNAAPYLLRSIQSVQQQTYQDIEIIVIDDGSTDSTREILCDLLEKDPRIVVIMNPENKGPSYSRNKGIQAAKGDWIALLDSDDYYLKTRIESLVKYIHDLGSQLDLIADDIIFKKELLKEESQYSLFKSENLFLSSGTSIDLFSYLNSNMPGLVGARFGQTKPLIRKDFLKENSLAYPEQYWMCEDFVFYFYCLLKRGRFIVIPEGFYVRCVRPNSITTSKSKHLGRLSQQVEISSELLQFDEIKTNPKLLDLLNQRLCLSKIYLDFYQGLAKARERGIDLTLFRYVILLSSNKYLLLLFIHFIRRRLRSIRYRLVGRP